MKENPLPLMNEGLGELRVSQTLFYVFFTYILRANGNGFYIRALRYSL